MIPKYDVTEGARIVRLAADQLLETSSDLKGMAGSDLRRACGDLRARAEVYISDNVIGPKLNDAFDLARQSGATLSEFNHMRERFISEVSDSLVAVLLKNGCVCFSLQQMSMVIAEMTFTSREDVDMVRDEVNVAFDQAEEAAADEMVLQTYRTLVGLHAAVTFHLYDTARPLPQLLRYQFAKPRPTLVLSHRLYDTAARADELRNENKVIHPAFAPRAGRALAF